MIRRTRLFWMNDSYTVRKLNRMNIKQVATMRYTPSAYLSPNLCGLTWFTAMALLEKMEELQKIASAWSSP